MRHKLPIFIIFSFPFLFLPKPVKAELIYFRVEPRGCCQFSLTENLSQKTSGKVGPDCDFSLDLYAQGEWEVAGGYFDSPPYGWGGDAYYSKRTRCGDHKFSFTCSEPSYGLDLGSLPSYVKKIGEEDLPPALSGATYPKGKRYHFHLSSLAPSSGSFNLSFNFSADCQMKKDGMVLDPVSERTRCSSSPVININPRKANYSVRFDITDICTPTPAPTATPTPTLTPTPTPTPTPQPPASCSCLLLAVEGNPDLTSVQRGQTLNFIAQAYTSTPDTAKVLNMIFVLDHEGREVVRSGEVPATFKQTQVINGKNVDVYQSKWSYQVKSTDPAGLYHLNLIINCAWKEALYGGSRVLGEARDYYLKLRKEAEMLVTPTLKPTPTPKISGFQAFFQTLLNIFAIVRPTPAPPKAQVAGPTPPITIIAPKGRTLKLGTFEPLPPAKDCTELYFRVGE